MVQEKPAHRGTSQSCRGFSSAEALVILLTIVLVAVAGYIAFRLIKDW